jgi:hypothetical protein
MVDVVVVSGVGKEGRSNKKIYYHSVQTLGGW